MRLLDKANNSLSGRSLVYILGNLSLSVVSVFSAPLLVRLMSTEDYGTATIFITWVTFFAMLVGLRGETTIQNALSRFGRDRLTGYASSVLTLGLLFAALCVCASVALGGTLDGALGLPEGYATLALVVAFGLFCSNVRMSYCTATKNASGNLLISLGLSVSQLALSVALILVMDGSLFEARIAGYGAPLLAVGLGVAAFFWARGRTFVSTPYWRFCLSLSLPMIMGGVAYLVINQSDRLMINAFMGPSWAGVYSFAYGCAAPMSILCNSLNSAWVPEYFELMDRGEGGERLSHMRRYLANVTLAAAALVLMCPEVLRLLGTEDYYPGLSAVPVIVAGLYFQFLYTWPVNYETYRGKTRWIAVATLSASLLNVLLNYVLIPRMGILGAAVGSLLSFAALFLVHEAIARHLVGGFDVPARWYAGSVLFVALSLAASLLLIGEAPLRWLLGLPALCVLAYRVKTQGAII